jgi:phosphate uptake regulator
MFFKDLFQALRRRAEADGIQRDFLDMLADAQWMLGQLDRGLSGAFGAAEHSEFFEHDERVKTEEQKIRKALVRHLVIQPSGDAITCLKVMSLVKDAERIGDYCKNAMSLLQLLPEEAAAVLWSSAAADELHAVYREVVAMLEQTRQALANSDEQIAREVATHHREVKRHCDAITDAIVRGRTETGSTGLAVGQSLLARFLRRISSHIENINSSVLLPLHQLDFEPEPEGEPGV